jgi:hypothetical protein
MPNINNGLILLRNILYSDTAKAGINRRYFGVSGISVLIAERCAEKYHAGAKLKHQTVEKRVDEKLLINECRVTQF